VTTFGLDSGTYGSGRSDIGAEPALTPTEGIDDAVVDEISWRKGEPSWMTAFRRRSARILDRMPMAEWIAVNMPDIDINEIDFAVAPVQPATNRATGQHESDVVARRIREQIEAQGVLFCDIDTALREYPDLVKQYFGTVVPPGDNAFAALNSAVWSGGSFIYVPPGVRCEMPLQADRRVNGERLGQFERTLIIADEGSQVHYIEGCSAPVYSTSSLRSTVTEIVVKPSARVRYTTMQNWTPNVVHVGTERARVEAEGHIEWIDGTIGSKLTVKHPSVHLVGPNATAEVLSVASAGSGQHHDVGATMVHAAPETASTIVSRSVSKDGGVTTFRGLVRVDDGAYGCTGHVQCAALVLDEQSECRTLPRIEVDERDAQIGHDATVATIADERLFYVMSRGLSHAQATSMVVNGFLQPVTSALPMEYAVEWSRLIELQMEGSVG